MNPLKCSQEDYINVVIASPKRLTATEDDFPDNIFSFPKLSTLFKFCFGTTKDNFLKSYNSKGSK